MKIDLNKKYRYRNGEPARILCVDAPGIRAVVSISETGSIWTHDEEGLYSNKSHKHDYDLIEVREPLECWVRVATAENPIHSEGTPIAIQREDSREPGPADHWKVVKFREVID